MAATKLTCLICMHTLKWHNIFAPCLVDLQSPCQSFICRILSIVLFIVGSVHNLDGLKSQSEKIIYNEKIRIGLSNLPAGITDSSELDFCLEDKQSIARVTMRVRMII